MVMRVLKLNYQWQYSADGTSWTDCDGISAKTNIYTFQMAIDKIGQYRCIISDSNGTTVTSEDCKSGKSICADCNGQQGSGCQG